MVTCGCRIGPVGRAIIFDYNVFCSPNSIRFTNKVANVVQEQVVGYVCVEGGKIEAIKVFSALDSIYFFEFFQDFRCITNNPKTIDACISGNLCSKV